MGCGLGPRAPFLASLLVVAHATTWGSPAVRCFFVPPHTSRTAPGLRRLVAALGTCSCGRIPERPVPRRRQRAALQLFGVPPGICTPITGNHVRQQTGAFRGVAQRRMRPRRCLNADAARQRELNIDVSIAGRPRSNVKAT